MNCWVNRGAKGIALIDETRPRKLKYVFDVSNVYKSRNIGRYPHLWKLRDEHCYFNVHKTKTRAGQRTIPMLSEVKEAFLMEKQYQELLRHTFTTRLVEAGVNSKVVQNVLGHADFSTTMDIYTDVTKELKQREFGDLEAKMEKSKRKEETSEDRQDAE